MRSFLLVVLLLLVSLVVATPASAIYTATPSARVKERLEAAKENVCEARKSAIEGRMASLVRMATNMEEKFTAIVTRVQQFYMDKVLPSGKVVENYAALVADIDAKKALVDEALTTAQTSAESFNCETGTPRTLYTEFKTDMQAVKSALKDYRTSIKNLIVAVRGVGGSKSPTPSASPAAE